MNRLLATSVQRFPCGRTVAVARTQGAGTGEVATDIHNSFAWSPRFKGWYDYNRRISVMSATQRRRTDRNDASAALAAPGSIAMRQRCVIVLVENDVVTNCNDFATAATQDGTELSADISTACVEIATSSRQLRIASWTGGEAGPLTRCTVDTQSLCGGQ